MIVPYLAEWLESAVSEEIILANVDRLEGDELLEWLLSEKLSALAGHSTQFATAPVRRSFEQLKLPSEGGWRCRGLSLQPILDRVHSTQPNDSLLTSLTADLTGLPQSQWGCFKPTQPRQGWKKNQQGNWLPSGKIVKYEHPQSTPTSAFS